MKRTRSAAAVLLSVATVLSTAGCYQGEGETVSGQQPSGNGTSFTVSDLQVEGLTIVADDEGQGSLIMTVVNNGDDADALLAVGTDPSSTVTVTPASTRAPASPTSGPSASATAPALDLPAHGAVKVGGPGAPQITLADLRTTAGNYITVIMAFGRAGSSREQVLVVPSVGYYKDYGPGASPSPTAPSPSETDSEVKPPPNASQPTSAVSTEPAELLTPTP